MVDLRSPETVRTEREITFTSVHFRNFKAFRDFSVSLRHMNLLVGPNNTGKSTILGAFRILAVGLQRARTWRAEVLEGPSAEGTLTARLGYRIPTDAVPVSVANVHINFEESPATVTFRMSHGRELILYWPAGSRDCMLFTSRLVKNPSAFRRLYPMSIGVVPTLGPLDEEEKLVVEETLRAGMLTVRAARYFRNYWHHSPTSLRLLENSSLAAGQALTYCLPSWPT